MPTELCRPALFAAASTLLTTDLRAPATPCSVAEELIRMTFPSKRTGMPRREQDLSKVTVLSSVLQMEVITVSRAGNDQS